MLFNGLTFIPIMIGYTIFNMKKKGQYTMLNAKQQEYVDHAKKCLKNYLSVAELKKPIVNLVVSMSTMVIKNKDYKRKSLFKLPVEVMSLKTKHLIKS